MTQRTIDDVPQHLKDKYKPKLKDFYNQAAAFEKKLESKNDDLSILDMMKVMNIARKYITIALAFNKAGGSQEDFDLIDEAAKQEVSYSPKF